jgi:nucleoside-diphosphate-sugar epimerase
MAQRRIAVTGATGFIGTYLVEELLKRGHIVHPIGRDFKQVECDILYHLACPSTTEKIVRNPRLVMDTIMDVTRKAIEVCPTALFVNASSYGADDIDITPQGAYNVAKRCMEVYIEYAKGPLAYINYRLPAVYGPNMHDDFFIKRCVDGTAYKPNNPDSLYYIAHIDDVVDAMAECKQIPIEEITLGQIYELFNSGRRGLHRPASNQGTI